MEPIGMEARPGKRKVRRDGKGAYFPRFIRGTPRFVRANPPDEDTMMYNLMSIIAQMGGEMWAESEGRDKGCTFWFRLPIKHVEPE